MDNESDISILPTIFESNNEHDSIIEPKNNDKRKTISDQIIVNVELNKKKVNRYSHLFEGFQK